MKEADPNPVAWHVRRSTPLREGIYCQLITTHPLLYPPCIRSSQATSPSPLLVGGLFLLSRRQGGGSGGPGGGNNPMNFGKSKARFQMEPNTGINFADVAVGRRPSRTLRRWWSS